MAHKTTAEHLSEKIKTERAGTAKIKVGGCEIRIKKRSKKKNGGQIKQNVFH